PGDSGTDNVYNVTVQVSDGALVASQAIAVTVTNVNEVPVITSNGGGGTAAVSIGENRTAVTMVAATYADGSILTYSITDGVESRKFTINATSSALSSLPAPHLDSPGDSGTDNVYNVTVQVSDGALVASQAIAVTVTNVNEVPQFISGSSVSMGE